MRSVPWPAPIRKGKLRSACAASTPAGPAAAVRGELDQSIPAVRLAGVLVADRVATEEAAPLAAVDDEPAAPLGALEGDRFHERATRTGAIAGDLIHVTGPEALGAVVSEPAA